MKRKEKHLIISFLLVFCLLLTVTSILCKPKGYDAYDLIAVNRTSKAVKKEKKNSLDTLILGNSSAYTAYSPMQMWGEHGITSYNLGTANQRLCDSYALLQNAFKTQKPSVIILECNSVFNPTGVYQEKNDRSLSVLGHIFPVFHYHSLYKLLPSPKELLSRNSGESKEDLYKGYTPKRGVRCYKPQKDDDHAVTRKISDDASSYLLKINALCRRNHAKLLLVVTPAPAEWDAGESEGLKQWTRKNQIAFLDFNHADGLKMDWDKDSVDYGFHLNVGGSMKITKYLGDYLEENYAMKDHRNDPSYSKWQKIYESLPEYKEGYDPYGGDPA